MANSQILTRDANGVTFADPASPDLTFRFKTTKNKKGLNGVIVDNYLHEIIVNDDNQVTLGSVTANEALSVRFRISGSILSQDRLVAVATSVAAQLPTWLAEQAHLGFEPQTAPVIPA